MTELKTILEIDKVDRITIAGGAKDLASPEHESDRIYVLKQIKRTIELHHPPRIVLMAHETCGAYGNTPKEKILNDLVIAKQVVEKFGPVSLSKIPVIPVFVDFDGISFVEKD